MSLEAKIKNAVCGLTYVIQFGKYNGYTVGTVLEINPQYLLWANDNVEGFKLTATILETAREMADEIENEHYDYLAACYEAENIGNK